MKRLVPILTASSFTPPPLLGIQLAGRGTHENGAAWIHGSIAAPGDEEATQLLLAAFVIAVARTNQIPQIGKLVRQPGLVDAAPSEAVTIGGKACKRIAFSVHTGDLFEHPLLPDGYDLHAAAGGLFSGPLVLEPGAPPKPAAKKTAGDLLLSAYDAALAGRPDEALAAFELAFAKKLDAQLDPAHRYNAACVARRSAVQLRAKKRAEGPAQVEHAALLEKNALERLREDLRQRAEGHRVASLAWAASGEPEHAQATVDELYRGHVRYLRADADLAGLDHAALLG
jgi:hypothetical protein